MVNMPVQGSLLQELHDARSEIEDLKTHLRYANQQIQSLNEEIDDYEKINREALDEWNKETDDQSEIMRSYVLAYKLVVQVVKDKWIPYKSFDEVQEYLAKESNKISRNFQHEDPSLDSLTLHASAASNNPYCIISQ